MTRALTKLEFSLYALLQLKFGEKEFHLDSVKWYFSTPMLKKMFYGLSQAGWLRALGKGKYICTNPKKAIKELFSLQIEEILKQANLSYCFNKASAAEIWSNQTYIQRSWEYSPIFIKVLRKDLIKWKNFLKSKEINFFTEKPSNVLGEFVIISAVDSMKIDVHNNKPIEPLKETIKFCEENKQSFEYVLAYFSQKYGEKTSASKELLIKVKEAL